MLQMTSAVHVPFTCWLSHNSQSAGHNLRGYTYPSSSSSSMLSAGALRAPAAGGGTIGVDLGVAGLRCCCRSCCRYSFFARNFGLSQRDIHDQQSSCVLVAAGVCSRSTCGHIIHILRKSSIVCWYNRLRPINPQLNTSREATLSLLSLRPSSFYLGSSLPDGRDWVCS